MSRSSFRIFLTVALVAAVIPLCKAQNMSGEDTTKVAVFESPETTRYHMRLMKRQQQWNRLIPNLFMLQYAGDLGMFSGGIGWDYGRRNQWETHVMFGYLPPKQNYQHYWTFTLREVFLPWRLKLDKSWNLHPLHVSLAVNSILHHDFWTSEPDRYPSGYYGFSSKVRFQLGFGQRISWLIPENKRFLSKRISFYYEIVTCDLYIRQKFLNNKIPMKDIFALGLGMVYTI